MLYGPANSCIHITATSTRPAPDRMRVIARPGPETYWSMLRHPGYPIRFLLPLVTAQAQTQTGLDWRSGPIDQLLYITVAVAALQSE